MHRFLQVTLGNKRRHAGGRLAVVLTGGNSGTGMLAGAGHPRNH